jgi:hypothetical protein
MCVAFKKIKRQHVRIFAYVSRKKAKNYFSCDFKFYGGIACQTSNDTMCTSIVTKKFLKGNYLVTQCLPLCPLECNRTGYTSSISFSQLNGATFVSQINSNPNLVMDFVTQPINLANVQKSIVSVNIFYGSLSYTLSEEEVACDWVCVVSNIGGTLGLFMGAGILSLAEIVEVLMEVFFLLRESSKIHS